MRILYTALVTALPLQSLAQTDSESMASCAAIYAASQDDLHSDAARDAMRYGHDVWINAAIQQAQREGADNPEALVQATYLAKTSTFYIGGRYAVSAADYTYWMDYCRLFAFKQGIRLLP